MAEVAGLAASGAGLASLGIQILDGIIRLRELCAKIRDAPKELKRLLSELGVLAEVLEEYESTAGAKAQGSSTSSRSLEDAARNCMEVHQELNDIVQAFDKKICKSKTLRFESRASVKFALSDDRVEGLLRQIERAKSSTALAIQVDQSLLQKERFDGVYRYLEGIHVGREAQPNVQKQIMADVHRQLVDHSRNQYSLPIDQASTQQLSLQIAKAVIEQLSNQPEQGQREQAIISQRVLSDKSIASRPRTTTNLQHAACKISSRTNRWLGFGTLTITRGDEDLNTKKQGSKGKSSSTYHFVFEPWLLNWAFALITEQSHGRVRRTMETQRLVPPDAEIFQLCARGDYLSVQKLITAGKASVFDVTYEGVTPLIVATYCRHSATCQALLNSGAIVTRLTISATPEISIEMAGCLWASTRLDLPPASYQSLPDYSIAKDAHESSIRDTTRIILEQGKCELESGWIMPSEDNSIGISSSQSYSALVAAWVTVEDFLWLTEPDRIGLLDTELENFYSYVFAFRCIVYGEHDLQFLLAVFPRIRNVKKLTLLHDEHGRMLLHYLIQLLVIPRTASSENLCEIISRFIQAGADSHARHQFDRTLLMDCAVSSIYLLMNKLSSWNPGVAARLLSDGLNAWLGVLETNNVDLHQYVCIERQFGAEQPIRCLVDPALVPQGLEVLVDLDWYVQLTFIETHDTGDTNDRQGIRIEAEYFSVKPLYSVPGAWLEDEEGVDEQTSNGASDDEQDDEQDK